MRFPFVFMLRSTLHEQRAAAFQDGMDLMSQNLDASVVAMVEQHHKALQFACAEREEAKDQLEMADRALMVQGQTVSNLETSLKSAHIANEMHDRERRELQRTITLQRERIRTLAGGGNV